ncbi:MAG: competence protein ComEC [Parasphingorhabdus sp.]|jgi:competence protein ComEC
MYINGLFLLFFWCLGWAQFGFINSLYLIILLLVGLLFGYTRRKAMTALLVFLLASVLQYQLISIQYPLPWARKDLRMEACVTGLSRSQAGLSLMLSNAQIDIPSLQMHKPAKPTYLARPQVLGSNVKVTIYPFAKAAQPQLNGFDQALGLGYLMGRKVELIVRLKGPKNLQNPEHFDYVRWRQLRGQVASGYVKQWLATGGACNSWNWPKLHLDKLRQSLWQRIQDFAEIHAMSSVSVALWGALMLGQTSALSAHQWRVLAASGTTHLLVISGLHVGLVAGLVMLLMRLLTFPFGINSSLGLRVGAWVGLGAAIGFALLSGFGLPAQRAVIMLVGLMWGLMWGLQLSFTQRLFIAFFVTLVLQPLSAFSLGFWLSYTAVLALGLVWYGSSNQGWRHRIMPLFAAQAALSLLVLPVIAIGTGNISLVSPLVNLFLVPLFSLLFIPALLLISITAIFTPLDPVFFMGIDVTFAVLWEGLETVASLAWATVFIGQLPIAIFVSIFMVALLCLLMRRWHWPLLLLLMPLVLFKTLEVLQINAPKYARLNELPVVITLLDVGQGLSVWVRQGKHNMLYDVGNYYLSGFNFVDAVILPEMRSEGVQQLDLVVISHWDMDHSGGLETLLQQQTVQRLLLPSERNLKREQNLGSTVANTSRCASTAWQNLWQDSSSQLLWRQIALAEQGLQGNNASCVILLHVFGRQVLITGDIEAKGEGKLLEMIDKLDLTLLASEVLIAPHHGSKTSSTEAFLTHVRPAYVLVSAGKNNPYGHPHKNKTKAYWEQGSQWYNTGRHGQIKMVFNPNGEYQVLPFSP